MRTPTIGGGGERRYKGVRKRKWGRWVSEIRLPKSRDRIWLGSYASPEEAARAFDAATLCLRGRSAKTALNFPHDPPDIPLRSDPMSPAEIQDAAAKFARKRGKEVEVDGDSDLWGEMDWSFLEPLETCVEARHLFEMMEELLSPPPEAGEGGFCSLWDFEVAGSFWNR